MRLFGWMTVANGDDTGLANAATQAVAGKLNRIRVNVEPGRATPIAAGCWPGGSSSTIDAITAEDIGAMPQAIVVTGMRAKTNAPAPPPPPAPAEVMALQERLGDVRLYRIPIDVTVAARSEKQLALLDQPSVKVETVLRLRPPVGQFNGGLDQILRTRNVAASGLGLPLPAGKLELFQTRNGRRLLVGEGQMDDHTTGEKVECVVGQSTAVRARQVPIKRVRGDAYALTITNGDPEAHTIEVELPTGARAITGGRLTGRDGWMLWKMRLPANGIAKLEYRLAS